MGHKRETGEFYTEKTAQNLGLCSHQPQGIPGAALQRNLFGLILRVALLRLQPRRDKLDLSLFILVTALY